MLSMKNIDLRDGNNSFFFFITNFAQKSLIIFVAHVVYSTYEMHLPPVEIECSKIDSYTEFVHGIYQIAFSVDSFHKNCFDFQ